MKITKEICVGSIEDCIQIQGLMVDRIELNCALELGGLTPSVCLLRAAKQMGFKCCCMVRPRKGGFIYTSSQIEMMFEEARLLLENHSDGIVFGFLSSNHQIDKENTLKMVDLIHSYGKEAIFHKAFDACLDLERAIEDLISCKVDRILTQGGMKPIEENLEVLAHLQRNYGQEIEILMGGGVKSDNVKRLIEMTKISQVHFTGKQVLFDGEDYVAVSRINCISILENIEKL